MTIYNMIALFSILFIAALIPSVSSMTVFTRATSHGFLHGAVLALGVAFGDIFYIVIAIFGMSILLDNMANYFYIIKYLGGTYLIYMGYVIWRSKFTTSVSNSVTNNSDKLNTQYSYVSSFLLGFVITLGDQKAIIFYLGLLPTLLDLSSVTYGEVTAIIFITLLAVAGAKFCYAYSGDRARELVANTTVIIFINRIAASLLFAIGIFIIVTV